MSPQNVAACQKHKSRHSDGADDDAGRPTTAAVVDDGELVRGGNTKASGGDGEFIKFDVDCQNHKEKEADRDIRIRQYVTDESIVTRSHADVAECKDSVMSSHVEAASAEAVRYRRGCLLLGIDRVVGDDAVAVAAAAAAPETFQCGGNDDNCDDEDDDALDAHTYLTRYGIDHFGQSKGLCHEVVVEECVPCCRSCCSHGHGEDDKNKNGASSMAIVIGGLLVSAIRSEIFLYTLHVTAIVLGAVKEGKY